MRTNSNWFQPSSTVQSLRKVIGQTDHRIIVFDSGSLTEMAIHFSPTGTWVAPDSPEQAIRAYAANSRLVANGYAGGGVLDVPHVLPYSPDGVIPFRLNDDEVKTLLGRPIKRLDEMRQDPTMARLQRYFAMRRGAPKVDNASIMMRGARRSKGCIDLTCGVGRYSEKRDTQETDGAWVALTDEDRVRLTRTSPENLAHLEAEAAWIAHEFPHAVQVRDITVQRYDGLPPWSGAYHYCVGVAGVMVTDDGSFPVSVRKAGPVSVNLGLNVPASGGIDAALWSNMWNSAPAHEMLLLAMRNEIRRELGLPDDSYELHLAGFLRELTRGGSPEWFFVIFFNGTLAEMMKYVISNKDPERKELSGEMRAFSADEVLAAFDRGPELGGRFHHKLMAAISVCYPIIDRWLRR